jgi:GLPGLI family protein
MKKSIKIVLLSVSLVASFNLFAQKTISEGTIVYDISIQTGSKDLQMADALDGATTTVYLKGTKSRTDMVNALGSETNIHDAKEGNAVILKEYSGQKLMITLTKQNWEAKNKTYSDVKFDYVDETKTIAGYTCKKAIAKMANGKTFTVFYTTDLLVVDNENNYTFKNLPGLAMQYETEVGKIKINYTVSKISFDAVPASKFEFPKSGYRIMTYDENQQLKKAGNK